ncbi:hypothetical protein DIPPA_18104 [Diplonema papillatum]|nr:hypothetical protein DIPPA_18104 [Diplonema papillatum]
MNKHRSCCRALARQARRGAAASAYPQDAFPSNEYGVDGLPGGSSKLSDSQRLYYKFGPSNSFPGHAFGFNVPDENDRPVDPISGEPLSVVSPIANRKRDIVPVHLYEGENKLESDVLALKRNPPVSFGEYEPGDRYFMGNLWGYVGGPLDPYLRATHALVNGVCNSYALLTQETAEGIVSCAMDSSVVSEDKVLTQDLTDPSKKAKPTRVLQARFTTEKADQGFKELATVKNGSLADPKQPGKLEEEVKYHLTTCGLAFSVAGSAGSTSDDEVRAQVYTDNTAHALFFTHFLTPLPARNFWSILGYSPPIKIFHAPAFRFERERVIEEYGGPKPADMGLEHNKFVMVDPYSKPAAALIAGDLGLDLARDVLAYLNAIIMFEELEILTVPGDAILGADGESATVYIGASEDIRGDSMLYGAHHLTLSPDGLGRMWDAVTMPLVAGSKPRKYDLITKDGDKSYLTQPLQKRLGDETTARKTRHQHSDTMNVHTRTIYKSVDALEGMTLGGSTKKKSAIIRPNLVRLDKTKIVFVKGSTEAALSGSDAASMFADAVETWGYPYGSRDDIVKDFSTLLNSGLKCFTGPSPGSPKPSTTPASPSTPQATKAAAPSGSPPKQK